MSKVVAKLIRYGECTRCGDCCRSKEFLMPEFWENGKCKHLKDNECVLHGTDKYPLECLLFPTGRETYILFQLADRKRVDFRGVLPNCPFEFELVYE